MSDRRKKKVTAPEDILAAILRGDVLEIKTGNKRKKLQEKKK